MGSFSIWHWLVVLVIVMLIFGTKKLRNLGSDLGGAVKGFRSSMQDGESEARKEQLADQSKEDADFPENKAKDKEEHKA